MQIHGEIKAGDVGGENAVGDGLLKQANAFLFRAPRDAHEEAKDSGHGAQGVHVIVVKADAKIGVGQIRIESLGAQKMIASADAKAGGVAVFSAQRSEERRVGKEYRSR